MNIKLPGIGCVFGVLICGIISCSTAPMQYRPAVPIDLRVDFKPSLLTTLIDTIRLRVSYPETGEVREEWPSFSEGVIMDTLALAPGNNVEFHLWAVSGQGVVLYEGYDTLNVVVGSSTVVTIIMEPVVSMLRPSPLYGTVAVDGNITVGIDVYNITHVYGAAFRLYFDDSILTVTSVTPGSFLGGNIFFAPNVQSGYVAVGMSRVLPEPAGVDGSGRLATIVFTAIKAGQSSLVFDASRVKLTDQSGEHIAEADDIVLETGVIVVNGTSARNR